MGEARGAALSDPGLWAAAEGRMPRLLAGVAAGLARLDERLAGPGLGRLAEEEAVALARAEGARLRLETFLLWRHGAPGAGAEPGALLAAGWAARRLAGPPAGLGDLAALQGFLGGGAEGEEEPAGREAAGREAVGREPVGRDPVGRRGGGGAWTAEAGAWVEELAALGEVHPLTRGAAALALWHARGLGGPGRILEGSVLAARIAAEGQARARFLPLGDVPRLRRPRDLAAEVEARLAGFLGLAEARLAPVLAGLAHRAGWAARAGAEAASLPGRLPAAVAGLLAEESLVSANLVRDRLGVSQQAANAALRRLAAAGLVAEVSGQTRYRLWRARV